MSEQTTAQSDILELLSLGPRSIGMPYKFSEWREGQEEVISDAIQSLSSKRFHFLKLPTGAGKSLIYMAIAVLLGKRTCVITSTKALQQQLKQDFDELYPVLIKGMGNYLCDADLTVRANQAACRKKGSLPCPLRDGGCTYYDTVKAAKSNQLVITNYDYWLAIHRYGNGLGDFDLLILDEAHQAEKKLENSLTLKLTSKTVWVMQEQAGVHEAPDPTGGEKEALKAWVEWTSKIIAVVDSRNKSNDNGAGDPEDDGSDDGQKFKGHVKAVKKFNELAVSILGKDEAPGQSNWLFSGEKKRRVWAANAQLRPVYVAPYREELFRKIPNVLFVGATIGESTALDFGIEPKGDDSVFHVKPSTFPPERRPIIYIPTVQMKQNMDPGLMRLWAGRIDALIEPRIDIGRSGIIHTVSYSRRDYLMKVSKFNHLMISHGSNDAEEMVELYKEKVQESNTPWILISPSMITGCDFPGSLCRWQVMAKMPLRSIHQDPIHKRKMERNPLWMASQTAIDFAQAYGRGVRSKEDWCEFFILDQQLSWFKRKFQGLFPEWTFDSFRECNLGAAYEPLVIPD